MLLDADEGRCRHHFTSKTGRRADTATVCPASITTLGRHLAHPDLEIPSCELTAVFLPRVGRTAYLAHGVTRSPRNRNQYSLLSLRTQNCAVNVFQPVKRFCMSRKIFREPLTEAPISVHSVLCRKVRTSLQSRLTTADCSTLILHTAHEHCWKPHLPCSRYAKSF